MDTAKAGGKFFRVSSRQTKEHGTIKWKVKPYRAGLIMAASKMPGGQHEFVDCHKTRK
jgi:hypothetical protein